MANQFFNFKKFSINQDMCAMKVGTDGVLLGAWCPLNNISKILDVGTGTGLIALMLAQRCDAVIHALDIDKMACRQAEENFIKSPFKNRLWIFNVGIENFSVPEKYDLIVSNPPYFSNNFKPINQQRLIARHTETLSFETLIDNAVSLLNEKGQLSVIIPNENSGSFENYAHKKGLLLKQKCFIKPTHSKKIIRVMLCLEMNYIGSTEEQTLVISYDERHRYTQEYKELTKDFYLNF